MDVTNTVYVKHVYSVTGIGIIVVINKQTNTNKDNC